MSMSLRSTVPAVALMATAVIGTAVVTNAIASGPSSAANSPTAVPALVTHDGRGPIGDHLEDVADELNLDVAALREAVRNGSTIAEAAAAQGVDENTLVAALVTAQGEALDALVAEGRITQEEADERKAGAEERIREMVTSERPFIMRGGPGGPGRGFPGLEMLGDVAEELGLDTEALRASLAEGNTLAEAAAAQGVTEDALVDALVAAAEERIRELVNQEPGLRLQDRLSEGTPGDDSSESPTPEGSTEGSSTSYAT